VVDGAEPHLRYRREADRLVLEHTEVPEALGGRGIAGALVRFAVGTAARDGLTVAPWCPYARRWLREHPDVAATVTIDWTAPPAAG
jgi:predicted GNAT family acetyltransferase